MDDPERLGDAALPICSIENCEHVAAVVINGASVCLEHANQALKTRKAAEDN